jgi:predicted AlkP superfamily pyrophosphatase or phosphodiesterase
MLKKNKSSSFFIIILFLLSLLNLSTKVDSFTGLQSQEAKQTKKEDQESKNTKDIKKDTKEVKESKNYVVLISIDGLKPEYYTKADKYKLKIPNIRKLCQEGSFAEGSETIYPSLTYPSHTTLVTGVRPILHGVYANQIWLGPKSPTSENWYWYANAIKVPTLWSEARKAGLKTASVGWPVTTDAEIDFLVPEFWQGPFETSFKLSMEKSTPGLAEKITKSIPEPIPNILNDLVKTQSAITIVSNYKPNLLLIHFTEVDFLQHFKGIFSKEVLEKIEETDSSIGKIIETVKEAGILEKTSFFVVSDHGFAAVEKQFRPAVLLAKEGFISVSKEGKITDWQAIAFGQGGSTAIMLKDPEDHFTALRVTDLFERYAAKPNSPINRVIKKDEAIKLGANPNAICFLEAAPGYEISSQFTGDIVEKSDRYLATHGGLPTRSEMYASFIASGYGIKKGIREPFAKNINVAPTVAALLGFPFPSAEGKAVRDILTITVPKATK